MQLNAGLERLFAASDTAEQAEGVVDIMTMHKSKGLQFDTVILYGLHQPPRSEQAPLVRFEQSGGRVLLAPVKPRADKEADPVSRYLALREARRADYEVDRLLYVAATRARHRLHLVANVALDPATDQPRPPVAGSLLARLWNRLEPHEKKPPAHLPCVADDSVALTARVRGEPLRRIALNGLVKLPANQGPAARQTYAMPAPRPWGDGAVWPFEDLYETAIGTVAHAWLARIGHDRPHRWPASRLQASLPIMVKQLARAGIAARHVPEAAQTVLATLFATLRDQRGAWLLSQADARREWPLIDAAGKVSIIDLALSMEEGWLIVDYKTGRPHADELPEVFAARMRHRYGDQLKHYCAQVTALDGRPAKAALYFPRAPAWIAL